MGGGPYFPPEEGTMNTRSLLHLAAVLLIAGCGATVRSTVAPNANLGQYHTYSFFTPGYRANTPETPAEQQLREALRSNLTQKGLTEAPAGVQPDFEIAYHVKEQQKLDVNTVGYGFWGWYGGTYVTSYTEGTLIVDFIDPRNNNVFWRGTASDVVNNPATPDLNKLDKAVAKLVNQYPTQMTAAAARPAM
jgi:hypothetical protein